MKQMKSKWSPRRGDVWIHSHRFIDELANVNVLIRKTKQWRVEISGW